MCHLLKILVSLHKMHCLPREKSTRPDCCWSSMDGLEKAKKYFNSLENTSVCLVLWHGQIHSKRFFFFKVCQIKTTFIMRLTLCASFLFLFRFPHLTFKLLIPAFNTLNDSALSVLWSLLSLTPLNIFCTTNDARLYGHSPPPPTPVFMHFPTLRPVDWMPSQNVRLLPLFILDPFNKSTSSRIAIKCEFNTILQVSVF